MKSLDPRKWGKGKPNRENLDFGRTFAYGQSSKGDSAVEFDKVLGVNRELIHDPFLEDLMESTCVRWGAVYDEQGNPTKLVPVGRDYDGLAMRVLLSPLNRVSFISEKTATHLKHLARRALIGVEMNTPEHEFSMGHGNFHDSMLVMITQSIDDSIDGKKAMLLKRQARVTGVEVSERKKGERSLL